MLVWVLMIFLRLVWLQVVEHGIILPGPGRSTSTR